MPKSGHGWAKYTAQAEKNNLTVALRRLLVKKVIFACVVGGFYAFASGGCESNKVKVPSPLQELRDRYQQIEDDMKEAEVIEIFDGYESGVGEHVRDAHPHDGKPLKRPSKYSRMFVEKQGAVEGDHFVEVLFDEAGYVVGKQFGAFGR
jgi:hypothetical protein